MPSHHPLPLPRLAMSAAQDIEGELKSYAALCDSCLMLKKSLSEGAEISSDKAKSLIGRFVESGKAGLHGIERMPKSINPQGNKEKLHFSIIASAALPHPTAGLMLGLQYKGWGGYVKGMSNFTSAESTYTCLSDGTLPDGSEFWGGGKNNLSINVLTAGAMFPVIKNLSFRGIAAEDGITANWRLLAFSAGVTTVKFKTIQVIGCGNQVPIMEFAEIILIFTF